MTEAYSGSPGYVHRENDAKDIFQRSENKKSSRPYQTLRIAPATHPRQFPSPRGNVGLGNLPEDRHVTAANDLDEEIF
jgi:hypothetical protein